MRINFAVIFLLLSVSHVAAADTCLNVTARASYASDCSAIEFTVTNLCRLDVHVYPAELPWGAWWSISLDAVEQKPPQLGLKKLGYLYHNSADAIDMASGTHLSGSVCLSGWFVDFSEINRASAISVSWYYSFPERLKMPWVSGTVVFPKSGVKNVSTRGGK